MIVTPFPELQLQTGDILLRYMYREKASPTMKMIFLRAPVLPGIVSMMNAAKPGVGIPPFCRELLREYEWGPVGMVVSRSWNARHFLIRRPDHHTCTELAQQPPVML